MLLASSDAVTAPTAGSRVKAMYDAIQVGVPIRSAVIESGLTLLEFADLCDERPELPAAIVRSRLELRTSLRKAIIAAARDGNHKAAEFLLTQMEDVQQELAEVVVEARTGELGEMSVEQVEAELDGMFLEEE
jgi:hypothetical protein